MSGAASVSATGVTRSAISRSISAIGSSGPENAKQSSVSCAITRSASRRPAGRNGAACWISRSTIRSMSSRSTTGTCAFGSGVSEAMATMCGSAGCSSGLPLALRWTSSFGKASRL